MRPYLITEPDAAKLPRWALLLLCVLYVAPGFLGRDPWSVGDAAGFGVAHTMATGAWADWLWPNVHGAAVGDGPVAYWLAALFVRALPFLNAHFAVRLAAACWLTAALVATWYALYTLARRPETQPVDPFGASPSRTDFGRAIADAGLLLLLATFGLIARAHETTAEAFQVALAAATLLGLAHALRTPRLGGLLAGTAIGATVGTAGMPLALAMLVAGATLPLWVRQYRLVARAFVPTLVLSALAVGAAWPALLWASGPVGAAQAAAWLRLDWGPILDGTHRGDLRWLARNFPWFFWPTWPLAAWAAYAWRGKLSEPALAVPLATLAASTAVMLAGMHRSVELLLPMAPPMAMLAGVGLPMLRRRALSLIDWFSVATFTVFCVAMWAYWLAWMLGYPPRMSASIVRLAPGLAPRVQPLGLVFAIAATVAWLLLVRWRLANHPRALWRAVVLTTGGFVLAWSLLMSLWLPVFNHRKSHRDVAMQIAAIVPAGHRCVAVQGVPPAPRAGFAYFGGLRFARDAQAAAGCDWLLLGDTVGGRVPAPSADRWQPSWEGRRPADRRERYRLFRRVDR